MDRIVEEGKTADVTGTILQRSLLLYLVLRCIIQHSAQTSLKWKTPLTVLRFCLISDERCTIMRVFLVLTNGTSQQSSIRIETLSRKWRALQRAVGGKMERATKGSILSRRCPFIPHNWLNMCMSTSQQLFQGR